MPEMIRDGEGRGYLVGITHENRMLGSSTMVPYIMHASKIGNAYTSGSAQQTLSAVDTWNYIFFMKNTDPNRLLVIDTIRVSWNGGSTNFNRPMYIRGSQPVIPTGNQIEVTPQNINQTSGNIALGVFYKWDGVGAGMTASGPASSSTTIYDIGTTDIPFDGSIMMGLNDTIGFEIKSPEVGDCNISIYFYYINSTEEV